MANPTIGSLRARLVIQEEVTVTNARGGKDTTWRDLTKVWGSIATLSGLPYIRTDFLENNITHRIMIRYNTTIERKMRIVYGDFYYTIVNVIPQITPDKRFMELLVTQLDTTV